MSHMILPAFDLFVSTLSQRKFFRKQPMHHGATRMPPYTSSAALANHAAVLGRVGCGRLGNHGTKALVVRWYLR
jgi:hypothetical protein